MALQYSGQGDSAALVLKLVDKVWVGFGVCDDVGDVTEFGEEVFRALVEFTGVDKEDDFFGHLDENFFKAGLFFETFADPSACVEANAGDESGVDVVAAESGDTFGAVEGVGFGVKATSGGDDFDFIEADEVVDDGVGVSDDSVFEVGEAGYEFEGGSAAVKGEGLVGDNPFQGGFGDGFFLFDPNVGSFGKGLEAAYSAQATGSTVYSGNQVIVRQDLQVSADGLVRHFKGFGQVHSSRRALFVQQGQNFLMSFGCQHVRNNLDTFGFCASFC